MVLLHSIGYAATFTGEAAYAVGALVEGKRVYGDALRALLVAVDHAGPGGVEVEQVEIGVAALTRRAVLTHGIAGRHALAKAGAPNDG